MPRIIVSDKFEKEIMHQMFNKLTVMIEHGDLWKDIVELLEAENNDILKKYKWSEIEKVVMNFIDNVKFEIEK